MPEPVECAGPLVLLVGELTLEQRCAFDLRGLRRHEAAGWDQGLRCAAAHHPHVVVVGQGVDVGAAIQSLRQHRLLRRTHVVAMGTSARHRIAALELGADDAVDVDIAPLELVLRAEVGFRRMERASASALRVDLDARRAFLGAHELKLSPTEFELLHLFVSTPHHVFSREELAERVLGTTALRSRTIDNHVMRLRARLGDAGARIQAIRGFGYRLGLADAD